MNYLTYGDPQNKAIVFIHGMASTALLCFEPILKYFKDYYVVLVEVDGHCSNSPSDLVNLRQSCDDIENYVKENLDGHIFGLCGFSMGATMSVELIGRGNIAVDRTVLDAAFTVKMRAMTPFYKFALVTGIKRIQQGKKNPRLLMDLAMGKGNTCIPGMINRDVSPRTVKNVLDFLFKYDIPDNLSNYTNPILFMRGENEPYPKKSAKLLKRKYLPQLQEKVIAGMGHGQYQQEQPDNYAKDILQFLEFGMWEVR